MGCPCTTSRVHLSLDQTWLSHHDAVLEKPVLGCGEEAAREPAALALSARLRLLKDARHVRDTRILLVASTASQESFSYSPRKLTI
jgi:hypothetical protein